MTVFCEARGQIFTSSGGTCQEKTCGNLGQVICAAVPSPGCDCPLGMVRELTCTKRAYFINCINLVTHSQIVADRKKLWLINEGSFNSIWKRIIKTFSETKDHVGISKPKSTETKIWMVL